MIEIALHQAAMAVAHQPDGTRTIRLTDGPSQIAVTFDIPASGAPEFAAAITGSGIVPAPASALGDLH